MSLWGKRIPLVWRDVIIVNWYVRMLYAATWKVIDTCCCLVYESNSKVISVYVQVLLVMKKIIYTGRYTMDAKQVIYPLAFTSKKGGSELADDAVATQALGAWVEFESLPESSIKEEWWMYWLAILMEPTVTEEVFKKIDEWRQEFNKWRPFDTIRPMDECVLMSYLLCSNVKGYRHLLLFGIWIQQQSYICVRPSAISNEEDHIHWTVYYGCETSNLSLSLYQQKGRERVSWWCCGNSSSWSLSWVWVITWVFHQGRMMNVLVSHTDGTYSNWRSV